MGPTTAPLLELTHPWCPATGAFEPDMLSKAGMCFINSSRRTNFVINNTKSGGVTINDVMFHLAQSHLPFGGVGPSGYGHYHGYEGFLNFSNLRAVYYQSKFDKIFEAMRPPRGKSFKAFLDLMKRIS